MLTSPVLDACEFSTPTPAGARGFLQSFFSSPDTDDRRLTKGGGLLEDDVGTLWGMGVPFCDCEGVVGSDYN